MGPRVRGEQGRTAVFATAEYAMAYAGSRVITRSALVMLWLGWAWLVTGCTQTVRLPEAFPTPVTQKLPLRVGLYQDRPFRDYVHQGAPEMGRAWVVDLRAIHKTLFKTLLAAQFSELIEVDRLSGVASQPSGLEAIIEPQVQAFTLQTPSSSASPYYRVSVLYLLKIYSSQGELLGSWSVEGHGRGHPGWLQARQAVTEAVTQALRDVGAQIVIELAVQPAIRDALTAKQARDAGAAAVEGR